jgi:glycerol-3-phosphate acyltransferase PlsY
VELLSYGLIALTAYLFGSLPTGFLVGQMRGIDIRSVGSGNIGATNVLRALGKPAGVFVFLVDALKGWVAVAILPEVVARALGVTTGGAAGGAVAVEGYAQIVAGVFAILGHNYTCWLKFKGGKGIATSAGVLLALVPWALLTIFVIWVIVCALTRYVSLGSLAASAALPFASWATHESLPKVLVTGAMGLLAIYKHRGNIQRLFQGTEPRLGPKREEVAK